MARKRSNHDPSRRKFVKKAAYVAPAVLSLAVMSSYAKAGSRQDVTTTAATPTAATAIVLGNLGESQPSRQTFVRSRAHLAILRIPRVFRLYPFGTTCGQVGRFFFVRS